MKDPKKNEHIFATTTLNTKDAFAPVSSELDERRDELGWLNRHILDLKVNKEAKKVLQDAYVQFLEAKRKQMITQITLNLDHANQVLLMESMERSKELSSVIADLGSDFAETIMSGFQARSLSVGKQETQQLSEIESLFKAGELTQHRYERLKESAFEVTEELTAIVKSIASKIIDGHLQKISVALEVFKERQKAKFS